MEFTLTREKQMIKEMVRDFAEKEIAPKAVYYDKTAEFPYETFQKMAQHQFGLLFDELEKRWPIESVRLIHRVGIVKVNEPSLWVEVIAPHRGEAFAACQWLIDEMKRVVPIWKKTVEAV